MLAFPMILEGAEMREIVFKNGMCEECLSKNFTFQIMSLKKLIIVWAWPPQCLPCAEGGDAVFGYSWTHIN